MKVCRTCQVEKSEANFYKEKRRKDGTASDCKQCKNERNRNYRRNYQLRTRYAITSTDYDAMLAAQDSRCAICGYLRQPGKRLLSVDHDHKTGKVRGLLCTTCNMILGIIESNPDNLPKLIAYLNKHNST